MLTGYTFLSDHSYSLRPAAAAAAADNDELPLNQREGINKKRRRSSNRTNKTTSTSNRTVSIDRSSSDKENNSLVLSSSARVSVSPTSTSLNTNQSSTDAPLTKKKSSSRLSTRTTMTNSRTHSGKKQDNKPTTKTGIRTTQGSIVKKKKGINRGKTKSSKSSEQNSTDVSPSLSIEERVKLRRTNALPLSSSTIVETKPVKSTKARTTKIPSLVPQDLEQIHQSMTTMSSSKKDKIIKSTKTSPAAISTIKTKKLFLGSGLDLDNIVLGNRQRRSVVQT